MKGRSRSRWPILLMLAGTLAGPSRADEVAAAGETKRVLEGMRAVVEDLASDARRGRGLGTTELDGVTDVLARAFGDIGLEPALPSGFVQVVEGSVTRGGSSATVPVRNVVALVKGTAPGTNVVIGAHYDHLGADSTQASGDAIWNGADDNASGVAALLAVARAFAGAAERPSRTLVFVAFSGEESGLLGSKGFVASPPFPLDQTVAMINLDCVGRLDENRLFVLGTGSGDLFTDMLTGINHVYGFDLALSNEGYQTGDHAPFIERSIPALQLFTGGNADYHRVTDSADKIDYGGLVRVAEFATEIVSYLSDDSITPRFAGHVSEKPQAPPSGGRRVSLGTIPDFARESGGVLVSGIVPKSPAEDVGLRPGDVVVELDGGKVDNLADYQAALVAHAPGDSITVVVLRDGARQAFRARLAARK